MGRAGRSELGRPDEESEYVEIAGHVAQEESDQSNDHEETHDVPVEGMKEKEPLRREDARHFRDDCVERLDVLEEIHRADGVEGLRLERQLTRIAVDVHNPEGRLVLGQRVTLVVEVQ